MQDSVTFTKQSGEKQKLNRLREELAMINRLVLTTVATLLLLFPGLAMANSVSTTPHFKKAVWIVFENTNYQAAMAQPDFARLAKQGVSFSNMLAEVHPSQGNYVAMIAGSNLGIRDDKVIDLKDSHVGDLLEKSGLDWGVYAEDYPGSCFAGARSGNFVRKHVPFLSFSNVTGDARRCAKIRDESTFDQDMASGRIPNFSMYIPNMQNDGHDTGVDFAGKWLTSRFGSLLSQPTKLGDVLFILTFDESGHSATNQIYTVLIGSSIVPGVNTQNVTHASLLKMVEDEFGVGDLGRDDHKASVLQGIWR